jgi:protein phosphatase
MQLSTAAQTDIGLIRSENEDRLLCADDLRLYAVADGIGGLPGGAEAAATAIAALLKEGRAAHDRGKPLNLAHALDAVNDAVLRLSAKMAPDTGLGTTLCAFTIVEKDRRLHLANVGDSRCYLFREGRLQQLTEDDTVENEVLRRRANGEDVVLEDRFRNALTRCMGQPMPLDVQVIAHDLKKGDQILVCSDGISRLINDSEIARRLDTALAPAAVLASLVEEALACGGNDNATGVLVRVDAV